MSEEIDIIVYWVDGNDPKWQQKRAEYTLDKSSDAGKNRYRDMGTLKYLFRGIEKYTPWVRKVFFVSDGQIPEWMDTNNEKLQIVDHKDFIPKEYLPTFSANPIELNFHRIEGLSDNFIVMNDDFFFTGDLKKTDFFINGLPVDIFCESPLQYKSDHVFNRILFNNYDCVGKYFQNRKEYKKRLRSKILSPKYGAYFFYNLLTYILPYGAMWGLITPHFARPYRKCDLEKMWELEPETLESACKNRFRNKGDVSIYLFRYYNLLSGNFVPGNIFKMGRAFVLKDDPKSAVEAIKSQRFKMICINDECSDDLYDDCCKKIIAAFETILSAKSGFEI